MKITLEELKSRVPEGLQPIVDKYGPAFVAMTAQEIWAWIELSSKGNPYAAHKAILEKMPTADLLLEFASLNAAWVEQNRINNQDIAWQKDVLTAINRALLMIGLAAVGL